MKKRNAGSSIMPITHSIHELRRLDTSLGNDAMPESIKADELLNILWLSSPAQNIGASVDEITDIGLNGLIAVTLSESLPKASIIRELDDNLVKYTGDGITDRDVVLVATRIANRLLDGIHDLNKAARRSKEEFVNRIRSEAQKQEQEEGEQKEKLNAWFSELSGKLAHFERARSGVEKKKEELMEKEQRMNEELIILRAEKLIVDSELKRLQIEEEAREKNRLEMRGKEFIQGRVKRCQRRSRVWLIVGILAVGLLFLVLLRTHSWSMAMMYAAFPEGMFTAMLWVLGIAIGLLVTIYVLWNHNQSNIKAYEERVVRSDEYKAHMEEGKRK